MMTFLPPNERTPTFSEKQSIDELNQQAWALRISDVQAAIRLSEKARDAASTANYLPGLAHSLHTLGHCHFRIGEYENARELTLEAQALFEMLADAEGQADALNTVGNIDSSLGNHQTAYEYYLQSLKIRQTIGNKQAEAASWNNIGNAHFHLADHESALASHQKSLKLKQEIDDQSGVATSLNNIGNVYRDLGDFENARENYQQSLTIFQTIANQYGEAGALSNLGAIYKDLGEAETSLTYHHQSLQIEEKIGNKYGRAESLLQLGQLYVEYPDLPPLPSNKKTDIALDCLQQALALAEELQSTELLYKVNKTLSQLYEQAGDYTRALAHFQAYHEAEREVFDAERSEHMRKLQIIHQVETSRQEAELEHARAELFKLKNNELAQALKAVEEQRRLAEEANQFKTKLLSIAAHDLKNPLSAIYINAGYLQMHLSEDDPIYKRVTEIEIGSMRMQKLIDDLLDSTSIERGSIDLKWEVVDLSSLTKEVAENFMRIAQRKEQHLHIQAEANCLVEADQSRMWQILENLISNAIKYSPSGKRISITVTKETQHVCLAVHDEGPGLTAADKDRLFHKFSPLSAQPTGGESSTGLGLSIVKQLVELQNGEVWAESNGPQTGSTFNVRMPAASI